MRYVRRALGLSLASAALFWAGYFVWWPAIIIAPVPLTLAFLRAPSARAAMTCAVLGGLLVFRPLLHPLAAYGQGGVGLLSLWQALSLIPVALGLWWGARKGFSMLWLFPVLWTGAEVLRMKGLMGFPFSALALPCYGQRWMIQIVDLGGLHLLSLALCLPGALLLTLIIDEQRSLRRIRGPLVAVLLIWLGIAAYGGWRIRQIEAEMQPGPTVAVIQPDVPFIQGSISSYDPVALMNELRAHSEEALTHTPPPDLIVWPENIASILLKNREFLAAPFDARLVPAVLADDPDAIQALEQQWYTQQNNYRPFAEAFHAWTKTLGVPLVVGSKISIPTEPSAPVPFYDYNAAELYRPGVDEPAERQFKVRLFPVGEYLPGERKPVWGKLYQHPPLKFLAERSAGTTAGETHTVMRLETTNADPKFVIGICSEILYPETSGVFIRAGDEGKAVDFLVSIANEGKFLRNRALLVTYSALPFRAVEGRMAIARSANTGISCFVDPTGRLYGHVTNEQGAYWTGQGAPEADAIQRVLTMLREQSPDGDQLQADRETIERLRNAAGVRGYAIASLFLVDRTTPFQAWGHWLEWTLLFAWIGIGLNFARCK